VKPFDAIRTATIDAAASFMAKHAGDAPLIFDALLTAEDHRGRFHHGIDWFSIGRAILLAPCVGRVCAVSTIELQLVRTLRPRVRKDFATLFNELVAAERISKACPKQVVWAAYLNLAYYGYCAGYQDVRYRFLGTDKLMDSHSAIQIVSCLKYPLERDAKARPEHLIRTQFLLSRLEVGRPPSLGRRILDRHLCCLTAFCSSLAALSLHKAPGEHD
jgi:membrane carboxypeptidase/penicillin-binding protein PbpC